MKTKKMIIYKPFEGSICYIFELWDAGVKKLDVLVDKEDALVTYYTFISVAEQMLGAYIGNFEIQLNGELVTKPITENSF